jgi:hypothetical protein
MSCIVPWHIVLTVIWLFFFCPGIQTACLLQTWKRRMKQAPHVPRSNPLRAHTYTHSHTHTHTHTQTLRSMHVGTLATPTHNHRLTHLHTHTQKGTQWHTANHTETHSKSLTQAEFPSTLPFPRPSLLSPSLRLSFSSYSCKARCIVQTNIELMNIE